MHDQNKVRKDCYFHSSTHTSVGGTLSKGNSVISLWLLYLKQKSFLYILVVFFCNILKHFWSGIQMYLESNIIIPLIFMAVFGCDVYLIWSPGLSYLFVGLSYYCIMHITNNMIVLVINVLVYKKQVGLIFMIVSYAFHLLL